MPKKIAKTSAVRHWALWLLMVFLARLRGLILFGWDVIRRCISFFQQPQAEIRLNRNQRQNRGQRQRLYRPLSLEPAATPRFRHRHQNPRQTFRAVQTRQPHNQNPRNSDEGLVNLACFIAFLVLLAYLFGTSNLE